MPDEYSYELKEFNNSLIKMGFKLDDISEIQQTYINRPHKIFQVNP